MANYGEEDWVKSGKKGVNPALDPILPDGMKGKDFAPKSPASMIDLENYPFTRKMVLFVDMFFRCEYHWVKAAAASGYRNPEKASEKLRRHPAIQAAIIHRVTELREAEKFSLDDVLNKLWDEMDDPGDKKSSSQSARVMAGTTLVRAKGGFEKGRSDEGRPIIAVNIGNLDGLDGGDPELDEGDDMIQIPDIVGLEEEIEDGES